MEDSENTIKMDYFEKLEKETHYLYKIANEARSKGFDVETETEIPLAKDLAERVEGLVGPVGVAKRMKELEEKNPSWSREQIAFKLAAEISSQKIEEDLNNSRGKEKKKFMNLLEKHLIQKENRLQIKL